MSGDIYFGFDSAMPVGKQGNDGYVNSSTFMAFGELLDEALLKTHLQQLEEIKEAEAMMLYNFCRLPASDYNAVIGAIRIHVAAVIAPTPWQELGLWVWREMAEPFIRKDERYDFAFHHEMPPST